MAWVLLINTLYKDIIKLFGHGDMSVLQFSQGIDHLSILEVFMDHGFENADIIRRELTNTRVE